MNNTTTSPNVNHVYHGHGTHADEHLILAIKPYLLLILFIQGLLSTVGNLIIWLMTITMPTLRKKTSVYFILCLSFSDLLFGSSTIDHYFQSKLDVIPTWRCISTTIVSLSAFLISLTQTFLICLERTLHMLHFPNSALLLNDKRRTVVIMATWGFCVLYISLLVAIASRECSIDGGNVEDFLSSCTFVNNGVSVIFTPVYISVICMYFFLLYKIKKLQKSVGDLPENPNEAAIQNTSLELCRNIFKTMSVFVVMYIVSLSPLLFNLTKNFIFGSFDRNIFAFVAILISFNGLFSPLLYIWRFCEVRRLFEC